MRASSGRCIDRRSALRAGVLLAASALAAPMVGTLQGCASAEPRDIAYGRDQCANCRMVVSDPRYAAELVTTKGRTFVFDSIECLASFVLRGGAEASDHPVVARSLWVADHGRPGRLMPADGAWFLRAEGPGSPMGKGLMAFASAADARAEGDAQRAETLRWPDVLALVKREGLPQGGSRDLRG